MARPTTAAITTAALIAALLVMGAIGVAGAPIAGAAGDDPALGFTPITPCRIADTRSTNSPLADGASRGFAAAGPGSPCGIPQSAGAVEFSITAVDPVAAGYLRVVASGQPIPTATFLNYSAGRGITNTGTVPVSAPSLLDVTVANFGGPTHVVIDVQGYFDSAGGLGYRPLQAPCRAVDTRQAAGQRFADGTVRSFRIDGPGSLAGQGGSAQGCGIPTGVPAVELSITAVDPVGTGFLRAAPNDGSPFRATVLNFVDGAGATNTGTAALAGFGPAETRTSLAIRNQGGPTDLVIDILGYYPTEGGSRYHTLTPCRVADTRSIGPAGIGSPLADGSERALRLSGTWGSFLAQGAPAAVGCDVPVSAVAVEAAVTAIAPTARGFAQTSTPGSTKRGTVLNFTAGHSVTNVAALHLSGAGLRDLNVRHQGGSAGYIVDVLGWFDGPENDADSAEQVDAGGDHTCAVLVDQRAVCWGSNFYGQLGDRTRVSRSVPAPIVNGAGFELTGINQVDAGTSHTCATAGPTGSVICWGFARFGQVGDGSTGDLQGLRTSPTSVLAASGGLLANMVQVAAGGNHTCALHSSGGVSCWGLNTSGQIGTGVTGAIDEPEVRPAAVQAVGAGDLTGAIQVTAGRAHSCALMRDTTVQCWGDNSLGQLGRGTAGSPRPLAGPVTTFSALTPPLSGVLQVTAGADHTCATLIDGSVRCWGDSSEAQLGTGGWDGAEGIRAFPTQVVGGGGVAQIDVLEVAGGDGHSCVRLEDTTARCWGSRLDGRIGDSSAGDGYRTGPTVVGGGIGGVVELTTGGRHSCMLHNWGGVRCWGDDLSGQVGDGTANDDLSPNLVQGLGA